MKAQLIVNLIKYHCEGDDMSFKRTANDIAAEFEQSGNTKLAVYIANMLADQNVFVPQEIKLPFRYLTPLAKAATPLYFPQALEEEITGVLNATTKSKKFNRFLFLGAPGTGKTESILQIASFLERDVLSVNLAEILDSKLGESGKRLTELFQEIASVPASRYVILFDELDALVLDRLNDHDVREMGRVTSTFIRELDEMRSEVLLFATSNLKRAFDKALLRRFDAVVDFDAYSREDLIEVSKAIYKDVLKDNPATKSDLRIFVKILEALETIPSPGEMRQILRKAVAFSSSSNDSEYLRRVFIALHGKDAITDVAKLDSMGFSAREIALLTQMSKSSASRILNGGKANA